MNKIRIQEAIDMAKEMGLTSVEVDGVKFTFDKPVIKTTTNVPELKAEELLAPASPFDSLTDEEIQFWATPYYDELQEKKKQQQEKQKLEESTRG